LSALISLTDSRRAARVDPEGHLILLADQDRGLWDQHLIEAGRSRLRHADVLDRPGPYQTQAAISLVHAIAPSEPDTQWGTIVALYDLLAQLEPTPIVMLNRAAAVSKARGPEAGLAALDQLQAAAPDDLDDYRYYHAARADMLLRLGRSDDAAAAYRRALKLTGNDSEREFLEGRLSECQETP